MITEDRNLQIAKQPKAYHDYYERMMTIVCKINDERHDEWPWPPRHYTPDQIAAEQYDPAKAKPIPFFAIEGFEEHLSEEAKKVYLNRTACTVVEYEEAGVRKSALARYVCLEMMLEEATAECLAPYVLRFAKLYNRLVSDRLIFLKQLGPAMIVPLASTNDKPKPRACIAVFVASPGFDRDTLMEDLEKICKDLVGVNVFSNEGGMIEDFDWTLLDKI